MINLSKMGRVKITGGIYPISADVGSCIEKFVPPPKIQSINKEELGTHQIYLLEKINEEWQIIAHWLVHFRTGAVNIDELPFTLPEFQDLKLKAELYSKTLNFCIAVKEEFGRFLDYPTAYDWWRLHILEIQQKQIDQVLTNHKNERNTPLKGETEDQSRKILQTLKKGKNPLLKNECNRHLFKIYEIGTNYQQIAYTEQCEFCKTSKEWKEYLIVFNSCIRHLKKNKDIKSFYPLGGQIFYQDSQNRAIRIK